MPSGKVVAYYRVSTKRQGTSGLGLDGQREAVRAFLAGGGRSLVAEFTEVESGRSDANRPQLHAALMACRLHRATLVIAKLDRLSRNAAFLMGLKDSGIDFVCADMPSANRLTVGVMALVAQEEREAISARTKAALAQARARGVKLGSPRNLANRALGTERGNTAKAKRADARAELLRPIFAEMQTGGAKSMRAVAEELNQRRIPTATGRGEWTAVQVARVLERIRAAAR